MRTSPLLFLIVLTAGGVGVWTGMTYGGTEKGMWVERVLGAGMMLAGVSLILSRDTFNRTNTQLTGAGFAIMGVAWLLPSGWPRTATLIVSLGFMLAAVVRRRRASGARSSA